MTHKWQNMETAPRDGSKILVKIGAEIYIAWYEKEAEFGAARWYDEEINEDAEGWQIWKVQDFYYSVAVEINKPEGWQPLPEL